MNKIFKRPNVIKIVVLGITLFLIIFLWTRPCNVDFILGGCLLPNLIETFLVTSFFLIFYFWFSIFVNSKKDKKRSVYIFKYIASFFGAITMAAIFILGFFIFIAFMASIIY